VFADGYGLAQDDGQLLFCGPYATHTAGCMSSSDGGHKFTALGNVTALSKVGSWSEQQMTRLVKQPGQEELMMVGHNTGASAKDSDFLVSFSHDFGESWQPPTALPELVQPGCQGSVLAPPLSAGSGKGLVIVSHPNNGTGYLPNMHDPARNHMTLSYSRDGWENGWKNWSQHVIYSGFSGYSTMQVVFSLFFSDFQ